MSRFNEKPFDARRIVSARNHKPWESNLLPKWPRNIEIRSQKSRDTQRRMARTRSQNADAKGKMQGAIQEGLAWQAGLPKEKMWGMTVYQEWAFNPHHGHPRKADVALRDGEDPHLRAVQGAQEHKELVLHSADPARSRRGQECCATWSCYQKTRATSLEKSSMLVNECGAIVAGTAW